MVSLKVISLFKNRSSYQPTSDVLDEFYNVKQQSGSVLALSLFLFSMFSLTSCSYLNSSEPRYKPRRLVEEDTFEGYHFSKQQTLGLVREWNVRTNEIIFECIVDTESIPAKSGILIVNDSGNVIARGKVCAERQRHFAAAEIDYLSGTPLNGDWVLAVTIE